MNTFTETLDYIEHVSNYITDEVTENPGCCGVCLAENITEQQVTQITNELNLVIKDDPRSASAAAALTRGATASLAVSTGAGIYAGHKTKPRETRNQSHVLKTISHPPRVRFLRYQIKKRHAKNR